jgi:hypothetical protein
MTTGAITLPDAIRWAVLYQLNNVHTAMPGMIIDYDYTTQKAKIQPTINKVWTTGKIEPMPVLENVPVIFPQAGGASLSFPVTPGDTCLIVFCERSITEWLLQGGFATPNDPRKFDLSDAVAIMGLMPFNSTFPPRVNNTDLLLNYGLSSIKIGIDGSITITGPSGAFVNVDVSGNFKIFGTNVKIQTGTTLALGLPGNELINQLITALTQINNVIAALAIDTNVLPGTKAAAVTAETILPGVIANLTALDGTLP